MHIIHHENHSQQHLQSQTRLQESLNPQIIQKHYHLPAVGKTSQRIDLWPGRHKRPEMESKIIQNFRAFVVR